MSLDNQTDTQRRRYFCIYIYAHTDTYISVQNWKAINSEIYVMLHCTSLIAGLVNCRTNNTLRQRDLQAKIKKKLKKLKMAINANSC